MFDVIDEASTKRIIGRNASPLLNGVKPLVSCR
jgi:hypothetical protein